MRQVCTMGKCNKGTIRCIAVAGCIFAACIAPWGGGASAGESFVACRSPRTESLGRVGLRARGGAEQAKAKETVELVKINTENIQTTAGILTGLVGFLLGGAFVGAGLFAVGSYLARKEDDTAKGLKGISNYTLEALNYTADMDRKYQVTESIANTLSGALSKAIKPEDKASVDSAVKTLSDTVASIDEELQIGKSVGGITLSASEYAAAAVGELVKFNEENKVTEQLLLKVSSATEPKK
mmetsp:Transcript_15838/g.28885  ORF Transcript_15838/g.28885 Transcript_15838/m.28885 type:complete len:240 (-) Transcript_15838:110-829(-)